MPFRNASFLAVSWEHIPWHYLIFLDSFFFTLTWNVTRILNTNYFCDEASLLFFLFHLSKMWTGGMCLKLARTEYSESAPTHFCLSEVLTHFAFQASNPISSFCVLIISMNNPAACIHTSILLYKCTSLASSCALIWATWHLVFVNLKCG